MPARPRSAWSCPRGSIALAGPLVAFFVKDPQIASTARHALRLIALGFAVAGVAPLVSAFFQSLGRPRPSYLISIGTLVAVKIPLVVVLGRTGPAGIWVALPAGEAISAAASLVVLRRFGTPVPRARVRTSRYAAEPAPAEPAPAAPAPSA